MSAWSSGMTETQPQPVGLRDAVCMVCGYDISGTLPNAQGMVTCPECGRRLIPTRRKAFTKKDVHKLMFVVLVVPTTIPFFVALVMSGFTSIIPSTLAILYFLFGFLYYPVLWSIATLTAISRSRFHPRPYPKRVLPLIALAYALIPIGLHIVLWIAITS